jgi:hypothetical protein
LAKATGQCTEQELFDAFERQQLCKTSDMGDIATVLLMYVQDYFKLSLIDFLQPLINNYGNIQFDIISVISETIEKEPWQSDAYGTSLNTIIISECMKRLRYMGLNEAQKQQLGELK